MPILVECPRCKQSQSVADKMAGTYVTCAYCNGRLWVPKSMASPSHAAGPSGGPAAPAEIAKPPSRPTTAVPPSAPVARSPIPADPLPPSNVVTPPAPASHGGPGQAAPGVMTPVSQPNHPPLPTPQPPQPGIAKVPVPPPAPAPRRKVARFITADAARSSLTLSADGKLPDLHLTESDQPREKEEKPTSVNPIILVGAICLSIVASVILVFMDNSPTEPPPDMAKWRARRVIEEEYFSSLDSPEVRDRYQVFLRDAQRAYARGDRPAERKAYGKVLDMLRAEHGPFDAVTGSPSRDKRLEEQIIVLMREN